MLTPARGLRRRLPFLALPLVLALPACTAGIATRVMEPVRPPSSLEVDELAVLPVVTETGSEGFGPLVAERVVRTLDDALPGLAVLGPDEARERVGSSGAATVYAELLRDYESSGVADRERVGRVAEALGVPWFLSLRVAFTEDEVLGTDFLSEDVREDTRQELLLVARLWGEDGTGPAWEASARARTETGAFHDLPATQEVVGRLVDEVVGRLPVR